VRQRVFLGDHPAHRHADEMEVADAEMVDQRLGVARHLRRGIGPLGPARLADAAIVEAQHAEAGVDQRGDLEGPRQQIVGKSVDEDDGFLGRVDAIDLVVDRDSVDFSCWQASLLGTG